MSFEILSGKHAVLEALKAGKRKCHEIWLAQGRQEKGIEEIVNLAKQNSVSVKFVKNEQISQIATLDRHQGIAARFDVYKFSNISDLLPKSKEESTNSLILVLDGILDPQNLGSLVRSAHLLGVKGLIIPKDRSATITPTVVKASAGATEYLNIVEVTNLVTTLNDLKNEGFWVAGAAGEGSQNLYEFDFTGQNQVLVLGSEGKGLRRLVRESCDHLLYIPMLGQIESYNVSVAGAIIMAEAMRQKLLKT
ncbi:MAG: 23S rRNA (guanosine(2251)-2'-O)-methyltransferase RlmB [Pseudomonadota bacterium]